MGSESVLVRAVGGECDWDGLALVWWTDSGCLVDSNRSLLIAHSGSISGDQTLSQLSDLRTALPLIQHVIRTIELELAQKGEPPDRPLARSLPSPSAGRPHSHFNSASPGHAEGPSGRADWWWL